MSGITNAPNNFPRIPHPFVDQGRSITEPWLRLLQALWNRTGSAEGSNIIDTNDSVASLEGSVGSIEQTLADLEDSIAGITSASDLGAFGVLDEDVAQRLQPPGYLGVFGVIDEDPYTRLPPLAHPGYVTGNYYPAWSGDVSLVDVVPAVDRLLLFPFFVASRVSTQDWYVNLVLFPGVCSIKFGLWQNRAGRPVGPSIVSGAVTPAAVGVSTFSGTSVNLTPGWYWAGTKFTGTLPTCVGVGSNGLLASFLAGSSVSSQALANANQLAGLYFADAYANAMPDLTSQTLTAAVSGVPAVGFKVV